MRRGWPVAVAALLLLGVLPAEAQQELPRDLIVVSQAGGLSVQTLGEVEAAAHRIGGTMSVFHRGLLRLVSVSRNEEKVQDAPAGYTFPLHVGAIDPWQARPFLSPRVWEALRGGEVVVGERAAALRLAQRGDTFSILSWAGEVVDVRVGAVVADSDIDWFEMLLPASLAASLGIERPTYATIWGFSSAEDALLALAGTIHDPEVRITTGNLATSDVVMPTVVLKERFGEFAFRPGFGDAIIIDSGWRDANIVDVSMPLVGSFRCHRMVVPYLRGVLTQIEAEGLGAEIDFADFQASGGCYNPRLIRGAHAGVGISRHAWGVAFDLNPTTNPFGSSPSLSPRIGEIFRQWGFAWGAGWVFPDPMHFEWARLPNVYPSCAGWSLEPNGPTKDSWTVYPRRIDCAKD